MRVHPVASLGATAGRLTYPANRPKDGNPRTADTHATSGGSPTQARPLAPSGTASPSASPTASRSTSRSTSRSASRSASDSAQSRPDRIVAP
jgi:hypothetical protein